MEKVEEDLARSKSLREKQAKEFGRQLDDLKIKHEKEVGSNLLWSCIVYRYWKLFSWFLHSKQTFALQQRPRPLKHVQRTNHQSEEADFRANRMQD